MKKTLIILLALVFLVPVASGNAGVLFEDDFEDGNRNGWTHIDSDEGPAAGQWVVVYEPSKGYVLEGTASSIPQYVKSDFPLPDEFILELEAKTVTDGGTSASLFGFYVPWLGWGDDGYIGVHRYRPTQFPSFRINTWALNCVQNNTSPQDTSITPYQWHTFKLVKEKDWYTFYYDNNVVFQGWVSTDSSCTDLGGYLVLATSRSNVTRYDNIRISTISDEVTQYTVTDLGALQEGRATGAYDINEIGQVVGWSGFHYDTGSGWHSGHRAFLWDGYMQDIGSTITCPGSRVLIPNSEAFGINNIGQLVGQFTECDSTTSNAFFWDSVLGLEVLIRGVSRDVNDSGQVVGSSINNAFLWDSTNPMQFLIEPGITSSTAYGINDLGHVVGVMTPVTGGIPCFLYDATNGIQDIGTLGGWECEAWDINNEEQIAGYSQYQMNNSHYHAFIYDKEHGFQDLGTLEGGEDSFAYGINDLGQVVGKAKSTDFTQHPFFDRAFLYDSIKGMQDLNDLKPPEATWELWEARAINRCGQIVGWGLTDLDGDGLVDLPQRSFLLTPNPQPSAAYSEAVIADNPFAYYRLAETETSNPVTDEMGNHHGLYQNEPSVLACGALSTDPTNTAACFDSSQSQYIELTTLGDYGSGMTEGFTVEYWLKTTDFSPQMFLGSVRKKDVEEDPLFRSNFQIYTTDPDGLLGLYFRDDIWNRYVVNSHLEDRTVDIFDGQWHHMVHVYDPAGALLEDRMLLYMDGVRQTLEIQLKQGIPSDFSNFNVPMVLAAVNHRGEIRDHLNGCLDEVAFYTRPLTAEEVMSHYQAAIIVDTDGDGIPDDEDACSDSDLSPTVVIDGCDSGVPNTVSPEGCTISDIIAEYASDSTNHGKFASAVSHYTNDLKKAGVITGDEKEAIQSCVGQADIP